jgi:LysM repeat protein
MWDKDTEIDKSKDSPKEQNRSLSNPNYNRFVESKVESVLKAASRIDKGSSEHANGRYIISEGIYIVPEISSYSNSNKAFDTLYSVSKRFGMSLEHLKKINNLKSDQLLPGQKLTITEVKKSPLNFPFEKTIPVVAKPIQEKFLKETSKEPEKINSEISHYASQMDNTYFKENMYGATGPSKVVRDYNTCNVTSLAMALKKQEN